MVFMSTSLFQVYPMASCIARSSLSDGFMSTLLFQDVYIKLQEHPLSADRGL